MAEFINLPNPDISANRALSRWNGGIDLLNKRNKEAVTASLLLGQLGVISMPDLNVDGETATWTGNARIMIADKIIEVPPTTIPVSGFRLLIFYMKRNISETLATFPSVEGIDIPIESYDIADQIGVTTTTLVDDKPPATLQVTIGGTEYTLTLNSTGAKRC